MADPTPALPWAKPGDTATEPVNDHDETGVDQQEEPQFLTLEQANLALGTRIEVKWMLEPEADGEDAYERWWAGTITAASEEADPERPGAPVYQLTYESFGDFAKQVCHVVLTSEHTLRDLKEEDELFWRVEGDAWEVPEDDDEEDADAQEGGANPLEGVDPGVALTLDQFVDLAQSKGAEILPGVAGMMAKLQPDRQIEVAEQFRGFLDNMMSFLGSKMASKRKANGETAAGDGGDDGAVVTAEDVKEFTEQMREAKSRKLA